MAFDLNTPATEAVSLGDPNKPPVDPTFSLDNTNPLDISNGTGQVSQPTSLFDTGQYFKQKYNELFHKVQLYLDNSGSLTGTGANRYPINPSAVLNLGISDTLNDWVVDGSLTFMYLPEDVEASDVKATGQNKKTKVTGAKDNGDLVKSYQFRNDGFDLLRVMIAPLTDKVPDDPLALVIDEKDPKWFLSYVFSVYDVEDVSNVPNLDGFLSSYVKCMKLHFRDIRYQILKTTNLEYSTTNNPNASYNPIFASVDATKQTGGVLRTGDAILEVFNKAIEQHDETKTSELIKLAGPDWDPGISELFYTSPAEYSALDDVDYLYAHHVSTSKLEGVNDINDIAVLHTTRASLPTYIEELALTPISKFFEKATDGDKPGELQLEHFFVTAQTDDSTIVTDNYRAPIGNDKDRDLKTFKYGQILSYSFVDMSADVNSALFKSTPVYSVDIQNRIFDIKFQDNDVFSARKAISETYIKPLFKQGSNNEDLFLSTIHKSKEKSNVFPVFSLNGDNKIVRQKKGILDLIYTGLFQNACICFKTFGLTLRETGTFIGIDKVGGCADSDYNNKLYGQWFVVKVDHIFESGSYMNVIYAIKVHRYKQAEIKFGETK